MRRSWLWPAVALALDVVVRGDPERVRRVLETRSGADWNATSSEGRVTESLWAPARGAARYTYVATDADGSGRWVASAYQLAVGTYLGQRTHIRAYPATGSNWTALQAHTEYWDWFRLRHSVTGIRPGSAYLERDLRDEPFVAVGVARADRQTVAAGAAA